MQTSSASPRIFVDENFQLLSKNSAISANGVTQAIDGGSDSMLERKQFLVPIGSVPRALKSKRAVNCRKVKQ
jgi:hypothetical protein